MRFPSKYKEDTTRWLNAVGLYILRVGLAMSVLLNVIVGGENNQTTSARLWELNRNYGIKVFRLVDFVARRTFRDDLHCLKAWINWRLIKSTLNVSGYKLW